MWSLLVQHLIRLSGAERVSAKTAVGPLHVMSLVLLGKEDLGEDE